MQRIIGFWLGALGLLAAGSCNKRAASDLPEKFLATAWQITETTLDGEKQPGGDQAVLLIQGDRYLLVSSKGEVEDHGKFQPLGGRRFRTRNNDGFMDLDLTEATDKRAVIKGTLAASLGPSVPIAMVLQALAKAPALPQPKSLREAAQFGDLGALAGFLARKPDLEATPEGASTALMLAAINCHTSAVKALLDAGAKTETQSDGITALIAAAMGGDLETVKLLLARGADPKFKTPQGETALSKAVSDGSLPITAALVEAGSPLDSSNEYRHTLLGMAASGHGLPMAEGPDLVAYLLDQKLDPNQPSGNSGTPLQTATALGFLEVVKLLLARGADPTLPTPNRQSLLTWAKEHPKIKAVLVAHPKMKDVVAKEAAEEAAEKAERAAKAAEAF